MKLKSTLGAAVAAAALTSTPALAQDRTLTISVYAFAQEEFRELVYEPFEEKCGCDLVVETGNSVERMSKIEANRENPVIDMAVMSLHDALSLSRQDLLQKIDTSKLSNHGDLFDVAKDPLGNGEAVGYTLYATSIVYRTDKVEIASWKDLFQDKLKGRVALPDITTNQGARTLWMIGKAIGDEDMSLKAPMELVGENADDIATFYQRSSQLAQLVQQDEVWAAPVGRFAWSRFKDNGLDMTWAEPAEGQFGDMNVMIMPKGIPAENAELALEFMDYWLSPEIQLALAEALIDSPVNKTVEVSAEAAEGLTVGAELIDSLNFMAPEVILDNRDQWLDSWNDTVIQ
ncbi:ABC transporter substrate-binding protein [Litoreibacter arenae]|uniref:ABC transporter, periplasmic spermidine putrescine-binding protein PotD n=1 Tax=Litoreibacter arenae DSM 19593 TaxID=1123360 RepID=S9QD96_9RHOB|nr:ABC transporter substrate-binding protein [Litoreibacter arenae]EPX79406.1 ABC transporter, periplasmic spermidine putrescine-binding protein PotD [Litoreibacter arenae DSM 19593]